MSIAPQRPADEGPQAQDVLRDAVAEPGRLGERPLPEHHVCWLYEDRADFGRAAASFLGRGLGRHDRCQLIVGWPRHEAEALLDTLDGADEARRDGSLEVVDVPEHWSSSTGLLDHAQAETQRARTDGHRGLTVAIDATPLVADDEDRARILAQEHTLDRWMTDAPFAALCAYDHRQVGDDGLEVASLHPETNHVVDFQVFAARDGWLRITGAIDALNVQLFEDVLQRAVRGAASPVNIDARALQYVNQRGILALDALADRVNLVTDDAQILRLAQSLQVTRLQVRIG